MSYISAKELEQSILTQAFIDALEEYCKMRKEQVTTKGVCGQEQTNEAYAKICDELCSEGECIDRNVEHPTHYQSESGLEVIKVIEAFTEGLYGYKAVYTGNIIKYICRWNKKNGLEDLKKAKWYLEHLIKMYEKECNRHEQN